MRWEGEEQSGNVEDRRGMRPAGLAVGGGSIIILLLAYFLGVDPRVVNQVMQNVAPKVAPGGAKDAPIDDKANRFVGTVLRFTEKVWDEVFAAHGKTYEYPKLVMFTGSVQTRGCGDAPSAVGPFYCPADKTVYLDPTFFDELERKLGGSKAEFSQAYVITHEIGHHVQNLLGYSDIVNKKRRTLPEAEFNKWSVRLELQADYLAGVWAFHGQKKFKFIESGDIEAAIKSANAIGDDRLQKKSQGWVSPEVLRTGQASNVFVGFAWGWNPVT